MIKWIQQWITRQKLKLAVKWANDCGLNVVELISDGKKSQYLRMPNGVIYRIGRAK